MTRIAIIPFLGILLLTSCAMGPNYKRPQVPVPPQFKGAPTSAASTSSSIAGLRPFDLFHDDTLTALLKTALVNNND
jgi:outer membrane protein TolC